MEDKPTPIAELDHGPSNFEVFLENNQKKLIIAAVLIFLGVLGYVFWSGYSQMLEREPGEKVVMANSAEDYEKIIADSPNTRAAATSKILLAELNVDTAPDQAIEQLRDCIAKYPDHPLHSKAETSLGLLFLEQGKLDEAEASLTSVIDANDNSFIAPYAKIALADIASKKGNNDRAIQLYTEVTDLVASGDEVTIGKFSTYAEIAKDRLRLIDAAPPKKVKPAAKPVDGSKDDTPPAEQPTDPATPAAEPAMPTQPAAPAADPDSSTDQAPAADGENKLEESTNKDKTPNSPQ